MLAPTKESILTTVFAISALLLWISVSTLLPDLSWDHMNLIWSAIIATVLFLVMCGLLAILVDSTRLLVIGWALASYISVIWYRDYFFIGIATLFFCAGLFGIWRAKYLMKRTLDGGIIWVLRACLPITATFLAATIAVAAFIVAPQQSLEIEALVPRWLFDTVFDQKMGDMVHAIGINIMRDQSARFQGIFPIAYAVGFFIVLRIFGSLLCWVAIMIASLTLRILRRCGIIGIRTIQANVFTYSFF